MDLKVILHTNAFQLSLPEIAPRHLVRLHRDIPPRKATSGARDTRGLINRGFQGLRGCITERSLNRKVLGLIVAKKLDSRIILSMLC